MRRLVTVALAATCGVVAGCGADETAEVPLSATLQRSTLFETRRALLLEVRAAGGRDVEVTSIQLSSPLFEAVDPEPRETLVRTTDRAVAMPLPFGEPRCDETEGDGDAEDDGGGDDAGDSGGRGGADGPTELVAEVDGDEVHVPLDDAAPGVLASLHEAECAAAAVLADVELRLGDTWERAGPHAATGELEVTQLRPGATVAVEEVLGNVIFTVGTDSAAAPWLEVSDDQPTAVGAVTVDASRCDPHALIEYKRTFVLSARVGVDGGEPVRVDVEAEAGSAAHTALQGLLTTCIG
jgi:hypothetical protein